MIKLYYALWANLRELPLLGRAAIVIGVAVLLLWLVARPMAARILSWLLRVVDWLLQKMFVLWDRLISSSTAQSDPDRYAQRFNRGAERCKKQSQWLSARAAGLAGLRKPRLGWMVGLYAAALILIALPDILAPAVAKAYLPYFSFASDLYQSLEAPVLEAAAAYEPLIDMPEQAEPSENLPAEIWLSLSEEGWRGTNVRAEPGNHEKILTTISGDIQIQYLRDQDGQKNEGWVYIRLPDGTEGWIYGHLLTEIP